MQNRPLNDRIEVYPPLVTSDQILASFVPPYYYGYDMEFARKTANHFGAKIWIVSYDDEDVAVTAKKIEDEK